MSEKNADNAMHQVFISYASEKGQSDASDIQAAETVCSALEAQGIECFIAHRDIEPGDSWADKMIDALEQSQVVVPIVSANSTKSQWVKDEITIALEKGIKIFPFCIEDITPKGVLRVLKARSQWINAYPKVSKEHLDRLVKAVLSHLGKGKEKEPENIAEPPITKPKDMKDKRPRKIAEAPKARLKDTKEKKFPRWLLAAASLVILFGIVLGLTKILIKTDTPRDKNVDPVTKPQYELAEMPENVKKIAEKIGREKISKNEKQCWQADFGDGIVMVYIPEGEFTMGQTDEEKRWLIKKVGQKDYDEYYKDETPNHKVSLDGYWLGKHEVTVGQYKKFISATKHRPLPDFISKYSPTDNHPVVGVSWDDAVAYCDWLSKKYGLEFKLPSEAQWEKAARGSDDRKYPWGNEPPTGKRLNFADKQLSLKEELYSWADKNIDDGYAYTAPVGSYPAGASPYGLLDMAGNVWEWCSDWYDSDYYKDSPRENPAGPKSGSDRVLRGGSWDFDSWLVRCACRDGSDPASRYYYAGFRLAQELPTK